MNNFLLRSMKKMKSCLSLQKGNTIPVHHAGLPQTKKITSSTFTVINDIVDLLKKVVVPIIASFLFSKRKQNYRTEKVNNNGSIPVPSYAAIPFNRTAKKSV
jgi:hypothetical protein